MHLTIGACLAIVIAFSGPAGLQRVVWFLLSAVFALISLLTGRRKAIVQVVVFVGLFLWLLSRYGTTRSRQQLPGILITVAGLAVLALLLDPTEFLGDDFNEYIARSASAPGDLWDRFNLLGINAFLRGLEISNGIGLGVGTLAQTGASGVAGVSGAGFAFVSESGLGKIAAELGLPGLVLIGVLLMGLFRSVLYCLRLVRQLPASIGVFEIGLLAFALSNLPFFSAAAGVYGDPFILIICGLCFGSVLAVPDLLSRQAMELAPFPQRLSTSRV